MTCYRKLEIYKGQIILLRVMYFIYCCVTGKIGKLDMWCNERMIKIEEIWRDIELYGGYYQVSNLGRVKSMDRYITYCNGETAFTKGKIINGFIKPQGYCCVDLYKNSKKKKYYIHRLVAKAFIPNPNNYPQINHKDENPLNNNVDNLEWCDAKYNINYGHHNKNLSKANLNNIKKTKPIIQYDLLGNFIAEYISASEIERRLGFFATSITRCCKHHSGVEQCGGYKWEYKENLQQEVK